MTPLSVSASGNRILGVLWCTLAVGAGVWLILHGIRAARARRVRKPFREHEWYNTGVRPLSREYFRIVLGIGLVALVVWAISTRGL